MFPSSFSRSLIFLLRKEKKKKKLFDPGGSKDLFCTFTPKVWEAELCPCHSSSARLCASLHPCPPAARLGFRSHQCHRQLGCSFTKQTCTAIPLGLYSENYSAIFRFLTLYSSTGLTGTVITFTESSKLFGKNRLKPTSFLKEKIHTALIPKTLCRITFLFSRWCFGSIFCFVFN